MDRLAEDNFQGLEKDCVDWQIKLESFFNKITQGDLKLVIQKKFKEAWDKLGANVAACCYLSNQLKESKQNQQLDSLIYIVMVNMMFSLILSTNALDVV